MSVILLMLIATAHAKVPASTWLSPVEKNAALVNVAPFLLDELPVTTEEYLAFVREQPGWQRDRVPKLFAEDGYLSSWRGALDIGDVSPRSPVTRVSWFAARAYCSWRGARLPTMAEWEIAAASRGARDTAQILEWYGEPVPERIRDVGDGEPNQFGARDLHGLVWEWVDDFGSAMVSKDAREQNDGDVARFCGGGAVNAAAADDYAAFMRFAFRGSLEARFTLASLGFRCARGAR